MAWRKGLMEMLKNEVSLIGCVGYTHLQKVEKGTPEGNPRSL